MTVQLAFPTDARRDDLTPAEVAAVEAAIRDQEVRRAIRALRALACRCAKPWPERDDVCAKCGHEISRKRTT
jgi:hypothetical protein